MTRHSQESERMTEGDIKECTAKIRVTDDVRKLAVEDIDTITRSFYNTLSSDRRKIHKQDDTGKGTVGEEVDETSSGGRRATRGKLTTLADRMFHSPPKCSSIRGIGGSQCHAGVRKWDLKAVMPRGSCWHGHAKQMRSVSRLYVSTGTICASASSNYVLGG